MQGADQQIVAALRRGDLDAAPVNDAERVLLRYVEMVTRHAWRATAEDAQRLRDAGWTDEQVAEAVYVTALFAFFNRVADAFGLVDPQYDTLGSAPLVALSDSALERPPSADAARPENRP